MSGKGCLKFKLMLGEEGVEGKPQGGLGSTHTWSPSHNTTRSDLSVIQFGNRVCAVRRTVHRSNLSCRYRITMQWPSPLSHWLLLTAQPDRQQRTPISLLCLPFASCWHIYCARRCTNLSFSFSLLKHYHTTVESRASNVMPSLNPCKA